MNAHTNVKPDAGAVRQHLELLFGNAGEYSDGRIEIVTIKKDGGPKPYIRAEWFDTDQLDQAVTYVVAQNSIAGHNMYVGAALRHPDCPATGRGHDDDFYALTAVYADLDDAAAVEKAGERWAECKPQMIVATGTQPHWRLQAWWKLDEPITDPDTVKETLLGLAKHLEGDAVVFNPSRIMRVAGTIAWPAKEGRVTETTRIVPLNEPPTGNYTIEQIHRWAPKVATLPDSVNTGLKPELHRKPGLLGMPTGELDDLREKYMYRTVAAVFIELVGTTRSVPTAQELFDAAWPQYERNVDLTREGRGPDEFAAKCQYIINRFHRGRFHVTEGSKRLPLRTIEDVVAKYQERQSKREQTAQAPATGLSNSDPNGEGKPFCLLTWAERKQRMSQTRDYIVEGLVRPGTLVAIQGRPGLGKTALGVRLARHLQDGEEVLGRQVKQASVVYIAAEDEDDVAGRLEAEGADRVLLAQLEAGVPFDKPDKAQQLFGDLAAEAREAAPDLPVVIFVDTLRATIGGASVLEDRVVSPGLNAIRQAAEKHGVAVIILHHTNRENTRASKGETLESVVVCELVLVEGSGDWVGIEIGKNRNGRGRVALGKMKMASVHLEFGEVAVIGELVADTQSMQSKENPYKGLGKNQSILLRLIQNQPPDAIKKITPFGSEGPEVISVLEHDVIEEYVKTAADPETPSKRREAARRGLQSMIAKQLVARMEFQDGARIWLAR
jgi:hypothetical protein